MVVGEDENAVRQVPDSVLTIRMLKYVLKYKRRALLTFVTVVATTGLNLIPTLLYGAAIDQYIPNLDAGGLALIAVGYIFVAIATYAAQSTQNYLIEWLFSKMEYDLRDDIFDHIQKLSIGYFADKEP